MTFSIALLLIIISAAVVLFSLEQLPADVTAMGILLILVLTGLLPLDRAFAGFGSDTVIMIFGLLILTATLVHTGVVDVIGRQLLHLSKNKPQRLLTVIMVIAAVLSAFISNTATAALFVPIVLDLARRLKMSASKLLMPLAFAAILASSITLVSSSTNIVISGLMQLHDLPPLGMFELSLVGIPIALLGLVYMLVLGKRLIPVRDKPEEADEPFDIQPYLSEIEIAPQSPLIGKTLAESGLGHDMDLTVLRIVRNQNRLLVPLADVRLEEGDKLLVKGPRDEVLKLQLSQSGAAPSPTGRTEELRRIIARFEEALQSVSQSVGKSVAQRFAPALRDMHAYADSTWKDNFDKQKFARSLRELDVQMKSAEQEVAQALSNPIEKLDHFLESQGIEPVDPSQDAVYDSHIHGRAVQWEASDTTEKDHVIRCTQRGYRDKENGAILVEPEIVVSSGPLQPAAAPQQPAAPTLAPPRPPAPAPTRKGRFRKRAPEAPLLDDEKVSAKELQLFEVILLPRSPMVGRTLKSLRFRQRYGLQVLGINRRGQNIYRKLSDIVLRTGDELLVQGPHTTIATLDKENAFRVIGAVDIQQPKRERALVAVTVFAGVLALAALNLLPLPAAVWLGALLVFVTGCISPDTAYHAVEWKALIVIGCMLSLGSAMEYTGTAEYLATQIIEVLPWSSPAWLLSVFFALTMLLTQPMSNQAAAVIVLPVALETAMKLGLNPRTFAVMIAVGASCSFITPLEPACLIIYGPGRYKFMDFVKVGSVLTVLIYLIAILLVPLFWPL